MQWHTRITARSTILFACTVFADDKHAGKYHGNASAIGQPGNTTTATRAITVDTTDAIHFPLVNMTQPI
jgi:hypothetical protein